MLIQSRPYLWVRELLAVLGVLVALVLLSRPSYRRHPSGPRVIINHFNYAFILTYIVTGLHNGPSACLSLILWLVYEGMSDFEYILCE